MRVFRENILIIVSTAAGLMATACSPVSPSVDKALRVIPPRVSSEERAGADLKLLTANVASAVDAPDTTIEEPEKNEILVVLSADAEHSKFNTEFDQLIEDGETKLTLTGKKLEGVRARVSFKEPSGEDSDYADLISAFTLEFQADVNEGKTELKLQDTTTDKAALKAKLRARIQRVVIYVQGDGIKVEEKEATSAPSSSH